MKPLSQLFSIHQRHRWTPRRVARREAFELSVRRSVDVRVPNAMESPDHPEVPRSLEQRRKKQTRKKNRGEQGE